VQAPVDVCASFENVRLVVEATPGPGPARNAGSRYTSGDIIGFIDSDCVAQPGWISEIVKHFDSNPEVDFLGGAIRVLPRCPGKPNAVEAYEDVFSYRARMFVEKHNYAATGNMAVRRKVFEAVGPFNGISAYEDVLWGKKAVAMGYRISYLPTAVVLTPGCTSLVELSQRLRRLVVHDFARHRDKVSGRMVWLMLSLMMAFSPVLSVEHIARSGIAPLRLQLAVFGCLIWARMFRATLMLKLLADPDPDRFLQSWKRPPSK
jgi:cellulose synthase/poly-beta-1,6-N-acetylglucosamine synthase-like glycosyltransferase